MSHNELDRFSVITRVRERRLTQVEAARILDLSVRQVQRLCAPVVQQGADGLISTKRGRPSSRRFPDSLRHAESTLEYMHVTERYLLEYGKPVAFYSDKHAVFRVNKAVGTRGEGVTQFGRALHDLNIESICANSPAAKGRVEQANGTLQDRLVKELRLAGISSIAEGHAFLESFRRDYNARFGRAPASDHDAHRKLIKAERVRIDDIFSWQESRAVTRSLTLQYDKVVYLIKPGSENDKIAGQHVTVFDYPDGRFKIRYEGRELPYSVFDRLSQIRQADIVNNKRLGGTLAMAREAQLGSNERRSKSCPSRPFPSASRMQ